MSDKPAQRHTSRENLIWVLAVLGCLLLMIAACVGAPLIIPVGL